MVVAGVLSVTPDRPELLEWDRPEFSEPAQANLKKHGIDFIQVQTLWEDIDRVEIPARTEDEPRFMVIGKIGDLHWSAVITYREDKTRIISVRRSRREESHIYEG